MKITDDIEMQKLPTVIATKEDRYTKVKTLDENKVAGHSMVAYHFQNMIQFQSLRDIQFGFQMSATFVFSALIAYKSDYGKSLVIPYFLAVIPPLFLFDTFGGNVFIAFITLWSFLPLTIYLYILQVPLGMGYHNYASSAVLFFITCFIIGYMTPTAAARKITLVLPVIIFTTLITTPRAFIEKNLTWEILGMGCVALSLTLGSSLLLFPRFASLEIQDRFGYALARGNEVLLLAVKATMSNYKAQSEVYLCEAENIFKNMQHSQDIMSARAGFSAMEPLGLLRTLFRRYQPVFNRYTPAELTGSSFALNWHMVSIIHAARNLQYNEYHSIAADALREVVLDTVERYSELMSLVTAPRQDTDAINKAIVELKQTCDFMFGRISETLKMADKLTEANTTTAAADLSDGTFSDLPAIGEPLPKLNYDVDAKPGANRLTFSFFMFHLSELVNAVDKKFTTPDAATAKAIADKAALDAKLKAEKAAADKKPVTAMDILMLPITIPVALWKQHTVDWKTKTRTGLSTAFILGVAFIFVEVPRLAFKFEHGQWIMFAMVFAQGDNLGGTMYQSRNRFLGTLVGAIYAYFVFLSVGGVDYYKMIAMYVPFLLICGIIKQNRQWSYFGTIAAVTGLIVSFGRNPYQDPLAGNYALLRIQENTLGILLCLTCTCISLPVFAIDLLKLNIVSVFGELSKSTAKILDVYKTMINSVTIAVASTTEPRASTTADTVVSNNSAGTTVNETTVAAADAYDPANNNNDIVDLEMGGGELAVKGSLDTVTVEANNHERVLVVAYIEREGALIKAKLGQQPLLIEQSSMELIFWSKPFPEDSYHKLIVHQATVLRLVVSIDRALLRISKFTHAKLAENSLQFSQRVSGLVTELLNEVLTNLDRWSNQLKATVVNDNSVKDSDDDDSQSKIALAIEHPESRTHHSRGMERMHQLALRVSHNCLQFNNVMMREWLESMRPSDAVSSTSLLLSDAEIHGLMDIITTFNALFYASSHLASAAMDMGNTVYIILMLEGKRNHKQF